MAIRPDWVLFMMMWLISVKSAVRCLIFGFSRLPIFVFWADSGTKIKFVMAIATSAMVITPKT
jgi:hypothetical protein